MTEQGAAPRLLLVDDEVDYLAVLSKRLVLRGYDVTTARSGEGAIRALRKWEFDLAVVDLKLGDMDGIEVLKVFKRMDPSLAVIILTGHGSEGAARDAIALGASDYLVKPARMERLVATLSTALSSRVR